MEPVSILFSSFLTGMSSGLQNHITDVIGSEIQTNIVEYKKQKIDYQYQLWKVKAPSVCARVKSDNLSNHSSCTIAAKQFFTDSCSYLQAHPQQHWKYTHQRNMYCSASVNFKPTVAQISTPTQAESEIWEAKQKCSLLTLEARNSGSKKVMDAKDSACSAYYRIKQ